MATKSREGFTATLRARWLGHDLRRMRTECGLTLKEVATHLDRDLSALARYERAEWPIPRADVVRLLDLCGFHDTVGRDPVAGRGGTGLVAASLERR